jgi:hypothetical protein
MSSQPAPSPSLAPLHTCPNCGTAIEKQFCGDCGEQRFDRHQFSSSHFAHHVLHELLHLDSKIFRTIQLLLVKPGVLTHDYLQGRRMRYVAPLRLFLTTFAAVLFLYSVYRPVYDVGEIAKLQNSQPLRAILAGAAARTKTPETVMIDHLNERWHFYLHCLEIVNPLIMAAILALLYRKQRRFFAEHTITALYFLSFTCVLEIIKWPFFVLLIRELQGPKAKIESVIFFLIAFSYLWVTLRRVYEEPVGKTTIKSLVSYGVTQAGLILTTSVSFVIALIQTSRVG